MAMVKTYISGYWPLTANAKKDLSHYERLLPQTLKKLKDRRLVFFAGDGQVLEAVQHYSRRFCIELEGRILLVSDLPQWTLAGDLMASCARMHLNAWPPPKSFQSEKGVAHYWRDFSGSGPEVYRQLLAIWLSKIALVLLEARRSEADPAASFAWIDASLARIQGERSNSRFYSQVDKRGCLSHYASPMRYFGRFLPVSAGYLSAEVSVWQQVQCLFDEIAASAVAMAYAHDEETILSECARRRPDLFHCIGWPYKRLSLASSLRWRLQDACFNVFS